jgi:hypothetical protein
MERAELVSGRRLKSKEVDELCANYELKLRAV